jgi:hypothetical protein
MTSLLDPVRSDEPQVSEAEPPAHPILAEADAPTAFSSPSSSPVTAEQLEKLDPQDLARFLWSDLKQPGREAELHLGESILSRKTGERQDAAPHSAEFYRQQMVSCPLSAFRL